MYIIFENQIKLPQNYKNLFFQFETILFFRISILDNSLISRFQSSRQHLQHIFFIKKISIYLLFLTFQFQILILFGVKLDQLITFQPALTMQKQNYPQNLSQIVFSLKEINQKIQTSLNLKLSFQELQVLCQIQGLDISCIQIQRNMIFLNCGIWPLKSCFKMKFIQWLSIIIQRKEFKSMQSPPFKLQKFKLTEADLQEYESDVNCVNKNEASQISKIKSPSNRMRGRSGSSRNLSKSKFSNKKLFGNARHIESNETFLKQSNFQMMASKNKMSFLQASQKHSNKLSEKKSLETCQSPFANTEQFKLKTLQKHSLGQQSATSNNSTKPTLRRISSEQAFSDLSKVIYGQARGNIQDVSFQFIDESSIHGDQKNFFLDVQQKLE